MNKASLTYAWISNHQKSTRRCIFQAGQLLRLFRRTCTSGPKHGIMGCIRNYPKTWTDQKKTILSHFPSFDGGSFKKHKRHFPIIRSDPLLEAIHSFWLSGSLTAHLIWRVACYVRWWIRQIILGLNSSVWVLKKTNYLTNHSQTLFPAFRSLITFIGHLDHRVRRTHHVIIFLSLWGMQLSLSWPQKRDLNAYTPANSFPAFYGCVTYRHYSKPFYLHHKIYSENS